MIPPMSVLQEFKAFAMRGNVIDLAVWVIIGWAFGKIVSSLVADVIMPVIGVLTGGINFTDYKIVIREAIAEIPGTQKAMPALTLNWGNFFQATVDFLIVAFCIFLIVKLMSKLKRPKPTPEPTDSKTDVLLGEIRDLLKKK